MRSRRMGARLGILAGTVLVGAGLMGPVEAAPPGNNGTVKVDGADIGNGPGNEPHVGCLFNIDFYGYEANLPASIVFELQAPTGSGVIHTTNGTLDDDDASGGDLDGHFAIDLADALAGVTPHPEQGHHLKLTVTVDDANPQGAQVKYKTFWVEDCGTTTTTTEPEGSTTTTEPEGSTTTTEPEGSTTTTEPEGSTTTTEPEGSTTTTEPEGSTTTTEPEGSTTTTEPEGSTTTTAVAEGTTPASVDDGSVTPSTVQSNAIVNRPAPAAVAGTTAPLARTGFDARLVWLGALAVLGGLALELAAQRRRAAESMG